MLASFFLAHPLTRASCSAHQEQSGHEEVEVEVLVVSA